MKGSLRRAAPFTSLSPMATPLTFEILLARPQLERLLLPYVRNLKRAGIEGYGLKIVERVALEIKPNENNLEYLRTKKEKLGHVLHLMS